MSAQAETQANPAVKGGVAPNLMVSDAAGAADFYKRAFGADEIVRMPPDAKGRIMHIHLYINGGSVMLSDAFPEHGHALEKPQAFNLHLPIEGDIEAAWKRAVDAGAEILLPLQVMFWGDRYGQVRDPYGVVWSMGQPNR